MDKNTKLKIVPTREAAAMQRNAFSAIFANEEEYQDLAEYVGADENIVDAVSKELEHKTGKASLVTPKNILAIMQLDVQGLPARRIALALSLEEGQIKYVQSSDAYKSAKEELLRQVVSGARKYMEVAALKAVKTLVTCLASQNEKVRLSAAQDILNRSGLQAPQQIEITSNVNNFEAFTTEQLAEILKKDAAIPKHAEVIEVVADSTDKD